MRNIFIACDTGSTQVANRIIKQTQVKFKNFMRENLVRFFQPFD